MLAFTRKPPPEDEAPGRAELLLDDAEDGLVPLAPAPASEPAQPDAVVAPLPSVADDAALAALRAFASSAEPQLGWRRVVFVGTGIGLAPSRAELALRAQITLLLECVGSSSLDPEKEASS